MAGSGEKSGEGALAYPGWRVVFVCFVLAVFAWGFGFYGQSVYVAQLQALHGWPVSTLASAATVYYLTSAVLVAFAGDAMARLGPRRLIGLGLLFLAGGVVATGRAQSLPGLYGAYLLIACGWASTSIAAITGAIGGWFGDKRGLAISLALNGASVGGVVGAPALVWAIDLVGFERAMAAGAGAMLLVVGPLLLFVWPAAGAEGSDPSGGPDAAAAGARATALRAMRFWTMTLAFAAALFVQVAFVVHQVSLIAPMAGVKAGGLAVSLTALSAVIGRMSLGSVVDRLDARRAAAGSFAVQVAALLIVMSAGSYPQLLAGCVLFGLSVGNLITLPALIVHREFAPGAFATVVSLTTAITQFTYAFGPGFVGWLRDATGGYTAPLAACAAIDVAAALLVLTGRERS